MSCDLTASVAVESTTYVFDKLFDYAVPQRLSGEAAPGKRVMVPFGRGGKKVQGIIFSVSKSGEKPPADKNGKPLVLKSIASVLDSEPVLSLGLLRLARFMKEHYFCTYCDAVKTMLPLGINYKITTLYGVNADVDDSELEGEQRRLFDYLHARRKPVKREKILENFALDNSRILDDMVSGGFLYKSDEAFRRVGDAVTKMAAPTELAYDEGISLTEKQKAVLDLLKMTGGTSVKEVCYFTGVSAGVADALYKKGLIHYYDEEVYRTDSREKDFSLPPLKLSPEQQTACDNLYAEYKDDKPHTSLLFGVTGSGKTSVFIKLIERVIDGEGGIIVMVPEISLTPQFISTFSGRFGDRIAVFHSALSPGERLDEFKRVKKGLAKIVIGTRSAAFAPFEKIGLIIMDEEQEHSYKSESSPRYHAREVAAFRCAQDNALLVLSSATPSVETFCYAQNGRYSFNALTNRYGGAVLPEVAVADMNVEEQNGNMTGFSEVLLENLRNNLKNGKQSILLLNRRGHNTFVTCRACGEAAVCPNCSISLTYHSANHRLMCHYCGYSVPYTDECPACHRRSLRLGGAGTQRAETDIAEIFPDARILRMDTDAASAKSSYERMIGDFADGKYDILVGTQMVAKGLNFPNVTLVGVLNTDHMLYADNYRSYERAFSLLTQVVGRSGRGTSKGIAVIQSHTPDNLIISMAANQDYRAFYSAEIKMRRAMLYPPFADICVVGFSGEKQLDTLNAARRFLQSFAGLAKSEHPGMPLRILGPSPASVVKVSNKFRYKLIIKCKNNSELRALMSRVLIEFSKAKENSGVSVFADMNALMS